MQDPFSPDFIDTPIAPEPPSPAPQPTSAQPAPSFPHRPARSMAVAMLAAGLVAGSVGGGAIGAALASQHKTAATTTASTVGAGVAAPAPAPGSFAAIYQQTAPGVVMISTAIARGGARSFSQAEGSGIVVDKQGDILTNAHVVSGATQIQVTFSDGHSATGQVKGVDQSAVEGNVGVGFAIPINRAETMLQSLEKGIAIEHPWLGISGQTLTATTASQLGLSEKSGVLIVAVVPNGPSAKAGLQADGQPS